jgi:hypothetical protein
MNTPRLTTHERVRSLLQLPAEAPAEEVFTCVLNCLTDALDCRFVSPLPVQGKAHCYRAAWLARDGTRYEGEGRSGREAALAAAVRLISESRDAALLYAYAEPELRPLPFRRGRRARGKTARVASAPDLLRVRRAGSPE